MVSTVQNFGNSATAKVALAGALAFGAAANAQTLPFEPGNCYDQGVVNTALEKDGQLLIFSGERTIPTFPYNLITMNGKGYGYNFEQKKRQDQPSQLCLRLAFKDPHFNYPDNPIPPSWAAGIKPNKGIDVKKIYDENGRLVFVAQSYTKDAQGNEIGGKSIVITSSNNSDNFSSVWGVSANGIPDILFPMRKLRIENMTYFIGRGFGSAETDARDRRDGTQAPRPDN